MEGLSVASKLPKLLGIENYFNLRTATEDALLAIGAIHLLTEDESEPVVIRVSHASLCESNHFIRSCHLEDSAVMNVGRTTSKGIIK